MTVAAADPVPSQPVPNQPVLQVEGLKAYYRTDHFGTKREVRAVDGISLEVRRNEIYGLAGESSSGKTSLIKAISGALKPPLRVVEGTVRFSFMGGRAVHEASRAELTAVRWKHLSYIMQGSMSVLNPLRRVRHSFRDFAHRHIGGGMAEFEDRTRTHLARLSLDPTVLHAYPHELSGGMRQRVVIALATLCRPEFIIADEPTTALDVVVQKEVLGLIREVQRAMAASVLFVTHDMGVHAALTDRLAIMYAGRIVEEGATPELFARPRHPYTRHLIASLPRIGDQRPAVFLEGTPPNLASPPPGCRFHPRCPLAMERCRREVPPLLAGAGGHRVACFAVAPEGAGS